MRKSEHSKGGRRQEAGRTSVRRSDSEEERERERGAETDGSRVAEGKSSRIFHQKFRNAPRKLGNVSFLIPNPDETHARAEEKESTPTNERETTN